MEFLISQGIPKKAVHRRMHLTVYYARRFLPGLAEDLSTPISIELNVAETRFMVLAPGGENPRREFLPQNDQWEFD